MRAGMLNQKVSLANATTTTPDSDGVYSDLTPRDVYASIVPLAPQDTTERTLLHVVTVRYHGTVGIETRIAWPQADGTIRYLFVKGLQDVDSRHKELRLFCEEVI